MVSSLPADVLLLICEEIRNKQDLGTLFNCALSSRTLVSPAISCLYSIHDQATTTFNNDTEWAKVSLDFQARRTQQIRTMSRWALAWRSLIRSTTISKTAFPYALYIRSLHLNNLTELLDDPLFREHAMEDFFAGDMRNFLKTEDTPMKKRTRNGSALGMRLDVSAVLDLVGEAITSHVSESARVNGATVALEDLAPGNISSVSLPRWTGRLSRLKSMSLWNCGVMSEALAVVINDNCPNFDDLTYLFCSRNDMDHDLASFFGGLRSNSLESMKALSAQAVGPETLLALNNHGSSLKTLELQDLRSEAIKNLSLLQGCVALETFILKDLDGAINLEATENDIFLEVVAWLGRCQRLQALSFKKLVSAPTILTHVCLNNTTHLRKLEVAGYNLVGSQDFHKALSHQTSLEVLSLTADTEGSFRDDIDMLVSSICHLKNLTNLDLCQSGDEFQNADIIRLASSLEKLEIFTFSGYDVTDSIWPAVSSLHYLRALTVQALTSFSVDGILNYISTLRPTNQGLHLSVLMQIGTNDLSERDRSSIQRFIIEKVDGKFEYVLFRDVESDEDSDSN